MRFSNPFSKQSAAGTKAADAMPAPGLDTKGLVQRERERTAAILSLAEAEGRRTLAVALACDGISVEDARIALAGSPTEAPPRRPWQIEEMGKQAAQAKQEAQTDAG